MYMRPPEGEEAPAIGSIATVALAVSAIAVVLIGLGPGPIAALARAASGLTP
jgi:hypothetical protein